MRKNILKNYGLKGALVAALGVCGMQHIEAKELQEILRYSLVSDPVLLEAKATENAAKSTTKATRARHFPVLALTGTQMLAQKHKNDSDDVESGFGVRGSLNLYSWGGINAAVRRDKHKETYQHHKYFETQEQLGNEIGKLYISALRAKEIITG